MGKPHLIATPKRAWQLSIHNAGESGSMGETGKGAGGVEFVVAFPKNCLKF